MIPHINSIRSAKIMAMAPITTRPSKNSYNKILRLKKIGSKIDVKNAPELKQTKVTETFEILMAWKNVTQCAAIITPERAKIVKVFALIFNGFFFQKK